MSEHRYGIRISESCIDPNPLMVERQDPDTFTRLQTRERCALEIVAYVFNEPIYALWNLPPLYIIGRIYIDFKGCWVVSFNRIHICTFCKQTAQYLVRRR